MFFNKSKYTIIMFARQYHIILSMLVVFFTAFAVVSASLASRDNLKSQAISGIDYDTYAPYLQVGGTHFFSSDSLGQAMGVDAFIPLLQSPTKIFFTHLRFYDRTGKPYEGNAHLGYRFLFNDNNNLLGFYSAFDRKKSARAQYFNQLTFGVEFWLKRLFLGGNYYQPIGTTERDVSVTDKVLKRVEDNLYNLWTTEDGYIEKSMSGGDAQVGYEFVDGLILYVGGYYFRASGIANICGSHAKLSYDVLTKKGNKGNKILGVFDGVGFELGVQHDKLRGTIGHVGLNLKVNVTNKNSELEGVARHMVDLIRRDVDIVTEAATKKKKETKEIDAAGKSVKLFRLRDDNELTGSEVDAVINHDEIKYFQSNAGLDVNTISYNDVKEIALENDGYSKERVDAYFTNSKEIKKTYDYLDALDQEDKAEKLESLADSLETPCSFKYSSKNFEKHKYPKSIENRRGKIEPLLQDFGVCFVENNLGCHDYKIYIDNLVDNLSKNNCSL